MPSVNVVLYREDDGSVPVADWLGRLPRKAKIKCVGRMLRLKQLGHEMRRPEAEYLRDDIYELRVRFRAFITVCFTSFTGERPPLSPTAWSKNVMCPNVRSTLLWRERHGSRPIPLDT